MTKIVLIGFIAFFILGTIYSTSTIKTKNWKMLDTSSFTIQYPQDWEIEKLNSTNYRIYDPTTLVHDIEPKSHQRIIYPERFVTLFRLDKNPLYQSSSLSRIEIAREYLGYCPVFTQTVIQHNKTTTILRCTDEYMKPRLYENIFYTKNSTLVLLKLTHLKYAEYTSSLESKIISSLQLK